MQRRTLLVSGLAVASGGVAGCLGNGTAEATNECDYPPLETDGVEVPLAPTADVYDWYEGNDDLLVVDTRSAGEYQAVRIADSELSPSPDGLETNDPIDAVDSETMIVTYCVCPHELATMRGSVAIRAGYPNVYALAGGLQDWIERGHPIAGTDADRYRS